jgi:hypothetical protein
MDAVFSKIGTTRAGKLTHWIKGEVRGHQAPACGQNRRAWGAGDMRTLAAETRPTCAHCRKIQAAKA